jgi:hypothetical protein
MHGRIARYSFTGDGQEISRIAEEGILPIFQTQAGFKAYAIVEAGDEIISFSAWESSEAADAANKVVASWVAENLADRVTLKDARIGTIHLSTALGVGQTAGITA